MSDKQNEKDMEWPYGNPSEWASQFAQEQGIPPQGMPPQGMPPYGQMDAQVHPGMIPPHLHPYYFPHHHPYFHGNPAMAHAAMGMPACGIPPQPAAAMNHGMPPHVHPHMWAAHMAMMAQGMVPPGTPQQQGEQSQQAPNTDDALDPMFEQAQAMLEGALGEDAGMFKQILGTMGMNDKEFWKGAVVGAAAALVLSNENVRKGLMGLVSNAGSMLKSGGETVKETAVQTASSVKQGVSTGGEIFRDTYGAGKEGFKESLDRHRTQPEFDQDETDVEEMRHDLSQRPTGE
ncbi:hypothetical protein [Photobacterium aquae]|uniref:hypothetical protein n=1 Tax=Photobacterium aquae TaxID=1195763 RepID=UPI000A0149D8|nr:hypothetical protein [Photobacterium aquae]